MQVSQDWSPVRRSPSPARLSSITRLKDLCFRATTFFWRDPDKTAVSWTIQVTFADCTARALRTAAVFRSHGYRFRNQSVQNTDRHHFGIVIDISS
jgi:hypothetical protein